VKETVACFNNPLFFHAVSAISITIRMDHVTSFTTIGERGRAAGGSFHLALVIPSVVMPMTPVPLAVEK
jgi:hypothetical protein